MLITHYSTFYSIVPFISISVKNRGGRREYN